MSFLSYRKIGIKFDRRLAPQLNEIFPGGSPDQERLLQLLEDAFQEARYNPHYRISDEKFIRFLSMCYA